MAVIEITVYFDTICPWCYIGEKVLDRAIAMYQKTYPGGSQDQISFNFLPYYLKPDAPGRGVSWQERVAEKNGEERVNAIRTRLHRVGRGVGIEFSFNSKIGNTRDSHRLIEFAKRREGRECQKAVLLEVYAMHFERDADITSREDLVRAATACGLDGEEAAAFLDGEELGREVDELATHAREVGVCSVPTVKIGDRTIEGAEDASEFYEALVSAKIKAKPL